MKPNRILIITTLVSVTVVAALILLCGFFSYIYSDGDLTRVSVQNNSREVIYVTQHLVFDFPPGTEHLGDRIKILPGTASDGRPKPGADGWMIEALTKKQFFEVSTESGKTGIELDPAKAKIIDGKIILSYSPK